MAAISSLGVGSGLDLNGLLKNLLAAEGQGPSTRLDKQESKYQLQLSAIGTLKGTLSAFQSSVATLRNRDQFLRYLATSSDTSIVAASVSGDAAAGNHTIEVIKLAQAQSLASVSLTNITDKLGTGKLSFTVAGTTKSVDITNGSLQGIRDAVNSAAIGVSASVVNNGTGYQLVFSAPTGVANKIKIAVTDNDGGNTDAAGLSRLAFDSALAVGAGKNMEEKSLAVDAEATLDGILVKSASNTLANAIDGMSLTLKKEAIGTKVTIGVAQDTASISKAVTDFVDGYNKTVSSIKELSYYDAKKKQGGPLLGDAAVRGLMSELRQIIVRPVGNASATYNSLASIGVVSKSDGTLAVDANRLQKALSTKPLEVRTLLAGGEVVSSDPNIRYLKVPESLPEGNISLSVSNIGTQGSYVGNNGVNSFDLTVGSHSFSLNVNGVASGTVNLANANYTAASLVTELQTKINADTALSGAGAKVSVAYDAAVGAFSFTSEKYGATSAVSLVSSSADTQIKLKLGVALGVAVAGTGSENIEGEIGGIAGFGTGTTLSGDKRYAGLKVEIRGGALGLRDPITIRHGVIDKIDDFLKKVLASNGSVEAKTIGIKGQISGINASRSRLNERLESLKTLYTKQFSALDVMVAKMNATGSALTGQLSSLPGSVRR